MKALVWAGIVQGFATPPLSLLILLMTNIVGDKVDSLPMNLLGAVTVIALVGASIGLVVSWFH